MADTPIVQTAAAPLAFVPPPLPRWRGHAQRWAASALMVAMAGVFGHQLSDRWSNAAFVSVFIVFLVVGAGFLHVRHAGAQMISRAAAISTWTIGAILSVEGGGRERGIGFWLVALGALALVSIGGVGITDTHLRRRRGLSVFFTAAAVMALADIMTLIFCAVWQVDEGYQPSALLLLALMIPGVVGLYRLRGWGLTLTVVANVTVITLLATGVLSLPEPEVAFVLGATAVLQMASVGIMRVYINLGPCARQLTRRTTAAGARGALLCSTALMVIHVALKPRPRILDAIGL